MLHHCNIVTLPATGNLLSNDNSCSGIMEERDNILESGGRTRIAQGDCSFDHSVDYVAQSSPGARIVVQARWQPYY